MKAFIISLLFITSSVIFSEASSISAKPETTASITECEDFWYEVIFKDGQWWRYEYCGTELVDIIPIDWD